MTDPLRKCCVCGEQLAACHPNQRICSDECRAARAKEYRAKYYRGNAEAVCARTRTYALAHKDQTRDAQARYRAKNREILRAKRRKWRLANLERERARARDCARKWRSDHPDRARAQNNKRYIQERAALGAMREFGILDLILTEGVENEAGKAL